MCHVYAFDVFLVLIYLYTYIYYRRYISCIFEVKENTFVVMVTTVRWPLVKFSYVRKLTYMAKAIFSEYIAKWSCLKQSRIDTCVQTMNKDIILKTTLKSKSIFVKLNPYSQSRAAMYNMIDIFHTKYRE